ncbi:MAG: head-tail joining protein [Candidatus Acidiferrales bacterium]
MPIPSPLPAFGDADIPALLADTGVPVTIGGVAGIGLLDEADEIVVHDFMRGEQDRGQVAVPVTTLTVRTSDFPAVAVNVAVTVGSRNYTVRERLRTGDGGLTKLLLGST